MKRSELKENQYVRLQVEQDESFYSRIAQGRYFCVRIPASEPDDSIFWSQTQGSVIMYDLDYIKSFSNECMELISEKESERLNEVFNNKNKYMVLFMAGRDITCLMNAIDKQVDELLINDIDVWEASSVGDLERLIKEEIDQDDWLDCEYEINKLLDTFSELDKKLDALNELEDRYIRSSKLDKKVYKKSFTQCLNDLIEKNGLDDALEILDKSIMDTGCMLYEVIERIERKCNNGQD